MSTAGTVKEAVEALNSVRFEKLGDHLEGAKSGLFQVPPGACEFLACADMLGQTCRGACTLPFRKQRC